MQVLMVSFNIAQPSALHRPACTETRELQSLFLCPTEVVREGLLSDEPLGHVAWSRTVVCPKLMDTSTQCGGGMLLLSPDAQFQCEALYYSGPFHFDIYACAFEPVFLLLPPTAPSLFFKVCRAEGSFACLLHLGCLWQWHKHTAVFLMVRRQVHEELCPKEKQTSKTPSLSKPINCWSERQALEQLGVGRLPFWVAIQGPFSPRCGYLFPLKVKTNSLLKSFSKFPSFWSDAMKCPGITYWLGKTSPFWNLGFTCC